MQAIAYFLAAMVVISSIFKWYRTRNAEPLDLDAAEIAVLKKLCDDKDLTDIQLIKLVRQRHLAAGLVEAKDAVERL